MESSLNVVTEAEPVQDPSLTQSHVQPVSVPTEPHSPAAVPRNRYVLFLAVSLLVIVADQLSKVWIRNVLPQGDIIPVVPGWIHLSHVLNYGAAWGMLSGQRLFLVGITLFVIFVVARLAGEITQRGKSATIGLAFILGGAVGNLIDRILFASVTDFLDLDTPWKWLQTFPVFNLADSALTVGVILLLLNFGFGDKSDLKTYSH